MLQKLFDVYDFGKTNFKKVFRNAENYYLLIYIIILIYFQVIFGIY